MQPSIASIVLLLVALGGAGVRAGESESVWRSGRLSWTASGPLIDVGPGLKAEDPHVALKDPTIVFHDGRWHLFATLRKKSGTVCMQYLSFTNWSDANAAEWTEISFTDAYHCAPQVFYFTPHQRWYLIHQLADPTRTPSFGPCFSTTTNLADPGSWTRPEPMVTGVSEKPRWLDFWVICDSEKAHLFYTSLDGHMWRRETKLGDFPLGWSDQTLALDGDIFEATHIYKLQGRDGYLAIIEARLRAAGTTRPTSPTGSKVRGAAWPTGSTSRSPRVKTSASRPTGPTASATANCCATVSTNGWRSIRTICVFSFKVPTRRTIAVRTTEAFPGSSVCWSRRSRLACRESCRVSTGRTI